MSLGSIFILGKFYFVVCLACWRLMVLKAFFMNFWNEINKIIKMKRRKTFEYSWPFSLFISRLVNNNARKRWCGFVWQKKSGLLAFLNFNGPKFWVDIARRHRKRLKEFSSSLYVLTLFQVLFHRTTKYVILSPTQS
jgi:hypothetical protein